MHAITHTHHAFPLIESVHCCDYFDCESISNILAHVHVYRKRSIKDRTASVHHEEGSVLTDATALSYGGNKAVLLEWQSHCSGSPIEKDFFCL